MCSSVALSIARVHTAFASSSKIIASWIVGSLDSDAITDPGALTLWVPTLPTSEALLADVDTWTADTDLSLPWPLPLRGLLQHCEEMWPCLPQILTVILVLLFRLLLLLPFALGLALARPLATNLAHFHRLRCVLPWVLRQQRIHDGSASSWVLSVALEMQTLSQRFWSHLEKESDIHTLVQNIVGRSLPARDRQLPLAQSLLESSYVLGKRHRVQDLLQQAQHTCRSFWLVASYQESPSFEVIRTSTTDLCLPDNGKCWSIRHHSQHEEELSCHILLGFVKSSHQDCWRRTWGGLHSNGECSVDRSSISSDREGPIRPFRLCASERWRSSKQTCIHNRHGSKTQKCGRATKWAPLPW